MAPKALHILGLEFLFGPVQQYAQDIRGPRRTRGIPRRGRADRERPPLTERSRGARSSRISRTFSADLPRRNNSQCVWPRGGQLRPVFEIERLNAARRAVGLKEHIVADTVDKSAQPLWILEAALFTQHGKYAGKCLLAHVFYGVPRLEPRAQLDLEQCGESSRQNVPGSAGLLRKGSLRNPRRTNAIATEAPQPGRV